MRKDALKASKKRKSPRKSIVVIISVILVVTALASILLWQAHLRNLRLDMETRLINTIEEMNKGDFKTAREEAKEARQIAERLKNEEAIVEIDTYINLTSSVIKGDELFGNENYQAALASYFLASDYIADISNIEQDSNESITEGISEENRTYTTLIDEKIARTKEYIAFYMMIEQAKEFASVAQYEAAFDMYEDAGVIATSLLYSNGIEIARVGSEEMKERIIEAKLFDAMNLYSQGELLYIGGQYEQALELFQSALDIYIELDDQQGIDLANTRIAHTEMKLAEEGAPTPPPSEPQDDQGERDDSGDLDDQTQLSANYDHNISIHFDKRTLIDNQHVRPANQIRMGSREGMNEGWYNGCGWVAAYNALIILGTPEHPADIVRYFEASGGTVLGGVFGTYPNAIVSYLSSLGYGITHTTFPQLTINIDEAIKSSRVSILAYLHTSAAHYITIEYNEDLDKFIVYNDRLARAMSTRQGNQNNEITGAIINSVTELINNTPEILFTFSLISVG